jgi:23S rRNA (cytosine1962-C5)-methyltransferase
LDWARENATAAGLTDRQIRWILDDALKFLKREYKRGQKYDGIVLNPPSFGRGPKGEIWRLEESLSKLLEASRDILHDRAVFMLISINDISDSSLALFNLLTDLLGSREGKINVGELVLRDRAKDKPMSLGIFGSWSNRDTV